MAMSGGAIGGMVSSVFTLAGGIMKIKGERAAIKGAYYTAYGNLMQSQEREYIGRYNGEVVAAKANTEGKAIEHNADLNQEANNKALSEARLKLNNSGVEMTGSPLLVISTAISDANADLQEANRQSDMVRARGRMDRSLLNRGADIEHTNRGMMIKGYKNDISGRQWNMAGTGMNTISSTISTATSGMGGK